MVEKILFIPILLGFLFTILFIPLWIRKAKKVGLSGRDLNKKNSEKIAEAGGISVLIGFVFGVLTYVAITTFYFRSSDNIMEIFSILTSILIVGFIGFGDDILGWKIGLNKYVRLLFLVFASIPLMVINAGHSTMMGFEFGLIYPLILIPLGIVGASATYNFLAGFNGLETSQGILVLGALTLVAWLTGIGWIGMISFIMVACLIAFFYFNKYPARVFPGDTLTYPVGALIAIIAIFGNIEKIAIFFFIPYLLEFFLKLRGKLKKESYGKVNGDGSLDNRYDKLYGLEHVAIHILKKIKRNKKVHETDVVLLINLFQMVIIVTGFILFKNSIFI